MPRRTLISKTTHTPRKVYASVDKLRKTSDRINTAAGRDRQNQDGEIGESKGGRLKMTYSSFGNRSETKKLGYGEFYGNPKDPNGERASAAQERYYQDYVWKVAFTNQHLLQVKDKPKVYVGRGNNSKLIKSLMKGRWWWSIEKDESKADFIWTQLKLLSVTTQNSKVILTRASEPGGGKEGFKIVMKDDPALQLMNADQYRAYSNYMKLNLKQERKAEKTFKCRKGLLKGFNTLEVGQVPNHIEHSRMIGNKKALFYTMRQYYGLLNKDYTKYLPLTFHIVSGLEDTEYSSLTRLYNERKRNGEQNVWIVKPGELSNRGNGITVCNDLDQIKSIIKSKKKHLNGKTKTYIVQLYMS